MCSVGSWGSKLQHRNWKLETMKLEISISEERAHVPLHVRCCCKGSNSSTLNSKIGRYSAFRIPLHMLCCHVGSNSTTLKLEIRSNFAFCIPLHVLCPMGIKSVTPKSEIENYEIRNSDFHEERPRVPLHVLYYCIGSNNITLKSKIEINSAFYISLHVLYCCMGIKIATPKLETGNYKIINSDFRRERPYVLLHVLYCHIGSNSATLKLKIGSSFAFCIPLHVLCYYMGSNSATLKSEVERNLFSTWEQ